MMMVTLRMMLKIFPMITITKMMIKKEDVDDADNDTFNDYYNNYHNNEEDDGADNDDIEDNVVIDRHVMIMIITIINVTPLS